MSNLTKYIENIKKYATENKLSETEIVRYIYLDLGKRFSFNQDFFAGNSRTKKKIYNQTRVSHLNDVLEEDFNNKTAICTSISLIIQKILKECNIKALTTSEPDDFRYCAHVFNIVIESDGKRYIVDLQQDLENIQSHSTTENFGLAVNKIDRPIFSRFELEQIDKKLGYIKDDFYYSDDYIYLMKHGMNLITNLSEKAEFAFSNLEVYENKEMKYPERYWYHGGLIEKLFTEAERRKIKQINCYRMIDGKQVFQNCIAVQNGANVDMYLYSIDESKYQKYTIDEFAKLTLNGLEHIEGVPGLKGAVNRIKDQKNLGKCGR